MPEKRSWKEIYNECINLSSSINSNVKPCPSQYKFYKNRLLALTHCNKIGETSICEININSEYLRSEDYEYQPVSIISSEFFLDTDSVLTEAQKAVMERSRQRGSGIMSFDVKESHGIFMYGSDCYYIDLSQLNENESENSIVTEDTGSQDNQDEKIHQTIKPQLVVPTVLDAKFYVRNKDLFIFYINDKHEIAVSSKSEGEEAWTHYQLTNLFKVV